MRRSARARALFPGLSALVAFGATLLLAASPAAADTKSWTGAVNNLWSVGGNWTGGIAPVDGDSLYFPYYGSINHATTNDIVGLTLESVSAPQGDFSAGGNSVVLNGGLTGFPQWNVPTTLGASQTWAVYSIGSTVDLNGHTLTLQAGAHLAGSVVGSGQLVAAWMDVSGTMTFTGPLVASGALNVYGAITNSTLTVSSGGTLAGSGTVPATSLTGATLQNTDVLSTGDLSLQGGTAVFQIRIDFAGAYNNKIHTTGTVTLANPTLQLNIPAGLPVEGMPFLLIDNDGTDPVVGTFAGLPEGATFTVAGVPFQISYVAGTGNDVVVTTLAGGPKAWNGGASDLWSAAGNWYGWAPPVSGDALYFPYLGAVHPAMTNDIAGLTIESASSPLGGFSVGGNAVVLNGGLTGFAGGWNVPTTLGASQTFRATNIGGPVDLNGHTLTLDGGVTIAGSIAGSGALMVPTGQSVSLQGTSTFAGPFVVSPGATLGVSGSITNSTLTVGSGGTLAGNGALPATSLTGATLQNTDVLSTGDLSIQGGTAVFQIRIDFAGAYNNKIHTTGTVTLANPTLQLEVPAGLPVEGMPFLLIDNDGTDPVVGTFAGLPEGATLLVAGVPFQISYVAGTGNDVVVTTLAGGPKAWNGGASDLWSAPGNWYGWAPPVSGEALYFPYYGAVHHAMTNDLVGLTIASANAPVGDFSVGGNAVVVNGGVTGFAGWNVPTTLGASQTFRTTNIGSTIDLNGHTLSLEGGTYVAGSFIGSGGVVLKTGNQLSVLGASTFTGPFVVSPGSSLAVSGSIANSTLTVGSGGTLTGGGTVPATSLTGATLQSDDVLSTGNLSIQGGTAVFQIRLDFTGAHNNKIHTTGAVTLGNPTLRLDILAGLPVQGQPFLLIDNDGADPVVGKFQGLPEGATFDASGAAFQISYVGGTGNDVVVTALALPSCAISSSANPAPAGAPIVLTAHVRSSAGQPTGLVSFVEATAVLGTTALDSNGDASITVVLAPGSHTIVARYAGAAPFGPSVSSPLIQTVQGGINPPAAIPTLNVMGLIVLAAGLAAAGIRLASR